MSDMTGLHRMMTIWTRLREQSGQLQRRKFDHLVGYSGTIEIAIIAAPLTDLTKKGQPNFLEWGEAQEKAFKTLREALLKRPILRLPDHSLDFTVRTDASNNGIGAVLMQEHEGKLHLVAYASKKLTNPETKYSTLEKKCLAIIWEVGKFRLFLAGKKFVLQTDHKPLTFLSTAHYKNDRILRWFLSLQGYDFVVKDIAGKKNGMADYLPASDPGSTAAWGSKRINLRPQSCLCLTWSGYLSKRRRRRRLYLYVHRECTG